MEIGRKQKIVHLLFNIGVIGKGVDGVLEVLGGVLLFFVSPTRPCACGW